MTTEPVRFPGWETVDIDGRPFLHAHFPGFETSFDFTVARTIAGRYRVLEILAIGETSVLLSAIDERTRRPVAVKAIRADSLDIPPPEIPLNQAERNSFAIESLRRARHALQTERRLLVRLRNLGRTTVAHPNDYVFDQKAGLKRLHPSFDDALVASEPYLVLELLEGGTLEQILHNSFPSGAPESLALKWMLPIVATLADLHVSWRSLRGRNWHVVYQDLKPANIVIDPSGRPRLIDFGGCQVVIDGVPVLAGSCTPGYAPPECLIPGPARVLLANADVYCIGSTLYQILSGVDPRTRPDSPLNADDLPRSVSNSLRSFVSRCLSPRPSDRFADAARALEALSA